MATCSLNRPLYPILHSVSSSLLRPTVLSTAICLLHSHLYPSKSLCTTTGHCPPLRYSAPSMVLFSLYGPMSPLRPSVPSMVLCPLYDPLPPLPPSIPSTALCPLYCPLCPLQLYFPLYDPLSCLRPSVSSTALCSLYGPLPPLRPLETSKISEMTPLVLRNVLQNAFRQNSKGYYNLFRISNSRDYRDNHDYRCSSEIFSDNREKVNALVKKVAIIAIITSNKKR
jgi:hypothetical protein